MRNITKLSGNKADIVFIEVRDRNQVLVGKRSRDVNDDKVNELAESIEAMGVLEPIIVTYKNCFYTVVAGAHRWRAICKVWDKHGENAGDFNIPAKVIHVATGDEEVVELAENLHRNDLTQQEREVMATRYLQLTGSGNPAASPNPAAKPQMTKQWFRKWFEVTGLTEDIARRMWQEFTDAAGLTITPSKATAVEQQAFAAWHLAQAEQRKADEAAKAKQSEDEQAAAQAKRELEGWMEKCDIVTKWLRETTVPDAKLMLLAAIRALPE